MKEKIIQKTLRISEKESRIVNQEAKKYGLSVNQYFKMLLLHRPKDYPEIREILTDLRNEVNRVGNNINQIARKANESFIDRSDITLVITCLKKLVVSTDSVLGEIMEITRLKKK
ncbi:MAG: plasmid mobilization relaxosome protein MobC [Butyrivibrio crossotus]|nr:plasmid mobilization relaxosome protein MobC [Butyrivibrio crossotus]